MKEIERIINKKSTIGDMPNAKQICEQRLRKVIDDIEKVKVNEEEMKNTSSLLYEAFDKVKGKN